MVPDMLAEQRLTADPGSVRAARHAVAQALGGLLEDEALDGALLATSEVVTNAIEHGAPPIDLVISDGGGRTRVEVRDGSPALPRTGHEAAPTDIRGRGMAIVDGVSDRWGIDPVGQGKAVWFEIDL